MNLSGIIFIKTPFKSKEATRYEKIKDTYQKTDI